MKLIALILVIIFSSCSAVFANENLQKKTPSKLDFRSVAEAYHSLKNKEGVSVQVKGGWTIMHNSLDGSVWSFTPGKNHPAHPAAVKRTVFKKNGNIFINMKVMCQGTKTACDKLTKDFQALNEQLRSKLDK